MQISTTIIPYAKTLLTLAVGAIGAIIGYFLNFPVFVMTGPAILITALSLMGLKFEFAAGVRNAVLLVVGIGIGASVNPQVTVAILRWPLAFVGLAIMLIVGLYCNRRMLMAVFDYPAQCAVLAATPGHLSFVMSMGAELNANVEQIAIVQSTRLFFLTMFVPFAALAIGIDTQSLPIANLAPMQPLQLAGLLAVAIGLGLLLQRTGVPAPMLMGGLLASTIAHLSDLTPGPLQPQIAIAGFVAIGSMIGTRFSGINLSVLKSSILAGLAVTAVLVVFVAIAAWPVSAILNMAYLHVLVAFSPGGLETMIVLGAVLGANPGFVAAAHVARLLFLIVLVPVFLRFKS